MPIPDTIPSPGRARRVLVVADEEVGDAGLPTVLERHAGTSVELLVVVPARAGRLALWTSDDGPRRAAERRLDRSLARLRAAGIPAEGVVGDADPLLALEDTLRLFPADEILVVTPPQRHDGVEPVEPPGRPLSGVRGGDHDGHGRDLHRQPQLDARAP